MSVLIKRFKLALIPAQELTCERPVVMKAGRACPWMGPFQLLPPKAEALKWRLRVGKWGGSSFELVGLREDGKPTHGGAHRHHLRGLERNLPCQELWKQARKLGGVNLRHPSRTPQSRSMSVGRRVLSWNLWPSCS